MKDVENTNKFLFEVSWEICNKVGGIYTVITSKLQAVNKEFGENYILIGPLLEKNPGFIEEADQQILNVRHKLDNFRIDAKVGRWDVPTKPLVVLVAIENVANKDKLLYNLWEDFGVDSMTGGWDYVEPVLFGTAAGKAIEALSDLYDGYQLIAQFHEWMSAAGLFFLKKNAPHLATVFTTHATILGRSLAGSGTDLYTNLDEINADKDAVKQNVLAKYSVEKTAARLADAFTTVSEITSIEAESVFHQKVHKILPNGFDVKSIPDPILNSDFYFNNRMKLLEFASLFLQKEIDQNNTFIVSTSGRYEFHNKGIDVLIEALGKLKSEKVISATKEILVFFFVLAGAEEMHIDYSGKAYSRYSKISTHPLWNPAADPIVNACGKNDLTNETTDKINVIFIPVYLNGHDGVLNMEYYDALSACDLSVFASYYEPWGYTPLESIAYAVPTITTDLAGFGRWVLSLKSDTNAVTVLKREKRSQENTIDDLKLKLIYYLNLSETEKQKLRLEARSIALKAEWDLFYINYIEAYDIALRNCTMRLKGVVRKDYVNNEDIIFRGAESTRPRLRNFSVKSSIPAKIKDLRALMYNLWWSWNPDAHELFNRLDPVLYDRLGNNPVSLVDSVDSKRMEEISESETFIHLYDEVIKKFNKYLDSPKTLVPTDNYITKERPIAYFSMEFGFHESLPIYSGGLGILSGDHIKSASDLNIPLVGVGLLYKKGYFRQGISREGEQRVEYFFNDFYRLPLEEVKKRGKAVIISIDFPGRIVNAKVWKVSVGRISVYLLDTDILENSPSDREITALLYGGGKKVRIEQEIFLGIGGVKMLHELNISPSVYHLNEGHSAFLIIQRFINQIKYNKLDLDTAREVIRSNTVFTTHTPVPAGNESFDLKLVQNYLTPYLEVNGLTWQMFCEISGREPQDLNEFEMTILALKNTFRRNGVSKLHGLVSRKMWSKIYPGFLMEEVPITHITNGVHVGTWMGSEVKNLLMKFQAVDFNEELLHKEYWEKLTNIPDKEVWQTHTNNKGRLFEFVKEKITENWTREGEDPSILDKFLMNVTPSPLTIGFARRFATYKRATLIFNDIERLKKNLLNHKQPVQIIFAGKAHPDDTEGAKLIKEIVNISKKDEFLGKVIFLEDYDIKLARKLVSGVDLWLNNPIRPYEASGTSGMKAGINGNPNFSILDGWWDEGYDNTNGWAIGDKKHYKHPETQNIFDSESFFDVLEEEIIPAYYSRNNVGIPVKWVEKMKRSMITVLSEFNTHRMVKEYTEQMYLPAAKRYFHFIENNFNTAKDYSDWIKSIRSRFPSLHINNILLKGSQGDNLSVNDEIAISLELMKGRLSSSEIKAQLIIVKDSKYDSIVFTEKAEFFDEKIQLIDMEISDDTDNLITFSYNYKVEKAGKFNYGIRVVPHHPDLDSPTDLNLVYWA